MQIGSVPTNPFHIARAYGAGTAAGARPAAPAAAPQGVHAARANVARLSAGAVPGGVSFAAESGASASAGSLPLYRHPADKNAAATAVLSAGRTLDVTG